MAKYSRYRWIAFLGVLWVVVVGVAVISGLDRYEGDLAERSADALAAAGLDGVPIEVDGRDIDVEESPDGRAQRMAEVLRGVEGVRDVDVRPLVAQGSDERTAPTVLGTVVEQTTTTATTTTTTTTTAATTTTTATTTTIPAAAALDATLAGGAFRLTGVVPDEATAAALIAAANVAYAPFVETDITVAPEAGSPPWLAGAPQAITLLPMISEGTIRVENDAVSLRGRSPNEAYLAAFEQAVAATLGVGAVDSDVEITGLAAPRFTAIRSGDTLTLGGTLPSEEIRQIIVGGANAVYGEDAVVDQTEVGEGLYTSFWMYTMPGIFQIAQPFPEYELLVEDGVTTGALRGGASFAFGSAELTPELMELLGVGAAILARDLSLGTSVEGHTDSIGSNTFNQELSEQRARAAVDFLVSLGISPDRLVARGFGEERPLAPNDTPESRTLNRRVEFVFGPLADVTSGN